MTIFCPNCGTQNAGIAGARASCTACGSPFDVPADGAAPAPVAEAPRPPPSFQAPGAQVFSPNPTSSPMAPRPGTRGTNTLAIVSVVFGLVCCAPLVSPVVAIGCGIVSIKQIEATGEGGRGLAIAGILLGAVTALLQFFWLIGMVTRRY